jgi:hypothetical protein
MTTPEPQRVITWLSTNAVNPGPWQSGWKEHAVEVPSEKVSPKSLGKKRAICGLRPAHGWAVDLFIDEKCKRCLARLGMEAEL